MLSPYALWSRGKFQANSVIRHVDLTQV